MKRVVARVAAAVAVLLALGVSGVMCARVADRGRYATAYSTYSAGPQGARALFELVRNTGRPTQRWVEDLEGLPERGVLVALGGCLARQRRPVSRYERERLADWVRRGGTLMVFGAERFVPDDYPAHLERRAGQCRSELLEDVFRELEGGDVSPPDAQPSDGKPPAEQIPSEPGGGDPDGEPSEPASDAGATEAPMPAVGLSDADLEVWLPSYDDETEPVYLARAPDGPLAPLVGVPMVQPAALLVKGDQRPTVLAQFGERRGAVALEMGEGHLVLVASGSMLTNENILEHRGGVLFTRLLDAYASPSAPVVFDEYHLGTGGTRSLVRYLRQAGVGVVLLQLLFLGGLWIFRSGRRLGELEEPPVAPPGGTVSYVAATSALYSRSPDRGGIARILLIRALDRIATHQRIRARQPEALVEQLRTLGREQAVVACEALLLLFAEPVPTEKALLQLSKRVDALVLEASAPSPIEPTGPQAGVSSSSSSPPEPPTP